MHYCSQFISVGLRCIFCADMQWVGELMAARFIAVFYQ